MKLLPLLVAPLLLATIAPPATAFHGNAYTAHGIAQLPGDATDVWLATVSWNGWYDQSFTVTITDLAGGVVVDKKFSGSEQFGASFPCPRCELFAYHGWSLDPAVSFDIKGFVLNLLYPPYTANMYYTGNYGAYTLNLVVEQYE